MSFSQQTAGHFEKENYTKNDYCMILHLLSPLTSFLLACIVLSVQISCVLFAALIAKRTNGNLSKYLLVR